jgi:hypothetical protein
MIYIYYIQGDQKVSVHLTIIVQKTRKNTVLYRTRCSRTQFGLWINVWRLAGDTLNITCNFLYCNYQVHRLFDHPVHILQFVSVIVSVFRDLQFYWRGLSFKTTLSTELCWTRHNWFRYSFMNNDTENCHKTGFFCSTLTCVLSTFISTLITDSSTW